MATPEIPRKLRAYRALSIRLTRSTQRDTNSLFHNRALALVRNASSEAIEGDDPAKWEQWWTMNKAAFKARAPTP